MVENRITIPILIKLLATSIVASNFLGFSSNPEINFPLCISLVYKSSKSFWSKENNATSEPEIKAEQKSNIATPKSPKTKL